MAHSGAVSREFWRGRRVLVTGHSGFKGSWLVSWLLELGAEVSGLSLPPPTTPSLFEAIGLQKRILHHEVDIRDLASVRRVVTESSPEIVFHLAAQPLVRESYRTPVETYATNVMGTVHLLDAVRSTPGVRGMVVVTTDKCYENREWDWGYRETDHLGGFDPYSNSKGCAELVVAAYRNSFLGPASGTCVASARAGNVIGGGDWSAERLIPDAARAFSAGLPVEIRNPASTRPWQHVIEPIRGYLVLAQACIEQPERAAGAWNFGPRDEDAVSVADVMDRFAGRWGAGARWQSSAQSQAGLHEARLLKLDCSKARAGLGWTPQIPLERGIELTAEWYRAFYAQAGEAALRALLWSQIERHGMGAELRAQKIVNG